jgi:hypothetical protein
LATIYIPARRVILTALTRIVGNRNFVIGLTLALGAALYLWGRNELAGMFAREETGEIRFTVASADPGCPAPSVYLMPSTEGGVYFGVVDLYGGGMADPSILNIGQPAVALTFTGDKQDPREEKRADTAACRNAVLRVGGTFGAVSPLPASELPTVNVKQSPAIAFAYDKAQTTAVLTFAGKDGGDEADARTAFRIEGMRDIWQFGYRRINLWNTGRLPVNVFLLGEAGYAFMSDTFEPMKVPVRSRSVVAARLSRPNLEGGNAYQVFSRLIDYDARLQSRLITVTTIFGIGISLFVEGLILAVLKFARRFRPAGQKEEEEHEERG